MSNVVTPPSASLVLWNQAPELYARQLFQLYSNFVQIPDQDFAIFNDPYIWEKLNRDPVAAQGIHSRLHSIAGREWRIVPGGPNPEDEAAAEVARQLVKKIEMFSQARFQLAKFVFLGRSYGFMKGKRRLLSLGGGSARRWWTVKELVQVDRRRIRFRSVRDKAGNLSTVMDFFALEPAGLQGSWQPVADPSVMVKIVFDDEEGRLGYGRGLVEPMYFYFYAKGQAMRGGLKGLSRWAQGLLVASINAEAAASSSKSTGQVRTDFINELKKTLSDHIVAIDSRDSLEVKEPTGQGHQIVQFLLEYFDRGMTRLATGSLLPTGGGSSVGSNARAEVEERSTETLAQADSKVLNEALTRELIGKLWEMNRENLVAVGLGDAAMPEMLAVQEQIDDPEKAMRIIEGAGRAGLQLRKDEVYKAIGFTAPEEGDDVLELSAPGMGAPGANPNPFRSARAGKFSGFDPNQPRDEEGKWTDTGATAPGFLSRGDMRENSTIELGSNVLVRPNMERSREVRDILLGERHMGWQTDREKMQAVAGELGFGLEFRTGSTIPDARLNEIGASAVDGVARLRELGISDDFRVVIDAADPVFTGAASLPPAAYMDISTGDIKLNPHDPADRDRFAKVVQHEAGHVLHSDKQADVFFKQWSDARGAIAENPELRGEKWVGFPPGAEDALDGDPSVSDYAKTEPIEYVAEIFARATVGASVSRNALSWYARMGGPSIPGANIEGLSNG